MGVTPYYKLIWYSDEIGGRLTCCKNGTPSPPVAILGQKSDKDEAERVAGSLSRTRNTVYEIAACNDFQWFFTGTLNPEWHDRNDLGEFRKKLSQAIRDFRKKTGESVYYLIVPERHKNGAWHVHGLIGGLSESYLHRFEPTERLPLRILNRVREHGDVYNWEYYSEKFGFTTLTPIRDKAAMTAYITKYITKDMTVNALESGAHLYYASIGLNRADVLFAGSGGVEMKALASLVYDYENDYVRVKNLDLGGLNQLGMMSPEQEKKLGK